MLWDCRRELAVATGDAGLRREHDANRPGETDEMLAVDVVMAALVCASSPVAAAPPGPPSPRLSYPRLPQDPSLPLPSSSRSISSPSPSGSSSFIEAGRSRIHQCLLCHPFCELSITGRGEDSQPLLCWASALVSFPSPPRKSTLFFFVLGNLVSSPPPFFTTLFYPSPSACFFCAVALLSSNDSSPRGLRSSAPSCALFELDPERALDPVSRDLTSPTIIHPVSSQITTTLLV